MDKSPNDLDNHQSIASDKRPEFEALIVQFLSAGAESLPGNVSINYGNESSVPVHLELENGDSASGISYTCTISFSENPDEAVIIFFIVDQESKTVFDWKRSKRLSTK